jgi:hypothetical protein
MHGTVHAFRGSYSPPEMAGARKPQVFDPPIRAGLRTTVRSSDWRAAPFTFASPLHRTRGESIPLSRLERMIPNAGGQPGRVKYMGRMEGTRYQAKKWLWCSWAHRDDRRYPETWRPASTYWHCSRCWCPEPTIRGDAQLSAYLLVMLYVVACFIGRALAPFKLPASVGKRAEMVRDGESPAS